MLDSDIKTLIRSLVQVTRNSTSATALVQDVISGKGGGLVRRILQHLLPLLLFADWRWGCDPWLKMRFVDRGTSWSSGYRKDSDR